MPTAIDTSVAVPLLVRTHPAHPTVRRWRSGRDLRLAGHAVVETYSVLTRLPMDLRLRAQDAVAVMERAFPEALHLDDNAWAGLPRAFAENGIVGGAVYDALVAFAARQAGTALATRDARAIATYQRLGVAVEIVS